MELRKLGTCQTSLKQIEFPESLKIIDCALDHTGFEQLIIPETVVSIRGTFGRNLKELVIPDTVTDCTDISFISCSSLERLTLPNSMTHIKNGLFSEGYDHAAKLKRVNLPSSLQVIENKAFMYLPLEELIIPEDLTSIEFSEDICDKNHAFYGTSLSLATQARLKQLGYQGIFN